VLENKILLGSACLHLKKGQFTEAARLLDTSRRAISISVGIALAIDGLEHPSPEPELGIGLSRPNALNHALAWPLGRCVWSHSWRLVHSARLAPWVLGAGWEGLLWSACVLEIGIWYLGLYRASNSWPTKAWAPLAVSG
jgi:hypothetical protein